MNRARNASINIFSAKSDEKTFPKESVLRGQIISRLAFGWEAMAVLQWRLLAQSH